MNDLLEHTEYLLNEAVNSWLLTLDDYYKKTENKPYPDRTKTETDLRKEVLTIAKELGFDEIPGKDFKFNSNNANQFLKKKIPTLTTADSPENLAKKNSQIEPNQAQDISPKKYPKYEEFRRKYYTQMVRLGWPKSIKYPDVNDSEKEGEIEFPWSSITKSAYPFNARGKGLVSLKNYTKKIKDYLYTKFEDNLPGLKKLLDLTESILDIESQYLPKSKLSVMGTLMMNVFKGLGATQFDLAVLEFLGKKMKGITVFQYANTILQELYVKMSISDNTSSTLKNILFPLYKNVKASCEKYFMVGQVKMNFDEYDNQWISYFEVKVKAGAKEYKRLQDPFVYILENFVLPIMNGKGYNSKSGKNLDFDMTIAEIEKYINVLKKADEKNLSEYIKSQKEPIEFTYDAIDVEKKNKVVGKYIISFEYVVKGCKISVIFEGAK